MEERAMLRGISCVTSENSLDLAVFRGRARDEFGLQWLCGASRTRAWWSRRTAFRAVDFFGNRIRNSWMWQSCTHFFWSQRLGPNIFDSVLSMRFLMLQPGVMYLCTLEEVPYCIKFFSTLAWRAGGVKTLLPPNSLGTPKWMVHY